MKAWGVGGAGTGKPPPTRQCSSTQSKGSIEATSSLSRNTAEQGRDASGVHASMARPTRGIAQSNNLSTMQLWQKAAVAQCSRCTMQPWHPLQVGHVGHLLTSLCCTDLGALELPLSLKLSLVDDLATARAPNLSTRWPQGGVRRGRCVCAEGCGRQG